MRFGVAQNGCGGTHSALVAEVSMVNGPPKVQDHRGGYCGIVVHPDQAHAQIESGIPAVFGVA